MSIPRDPRPPSVAAMKRRCPECGRVFDLADEADAEEFHSGHDCEETP